jgi:hypothetical protein
MKRRIPLAVGLTALSLIGSAFIATGPAHAATTSSAVVAAANCDAWISGDWGHAKCFREPGTGSFPMRLDVICSAWWDADGHLRTTVGDGQTVELQWHCPSGVVRVSGGWG